MISDFWICIIIYGVNIHSCFYFWNSSCDNCEDFLYNQNIPEIHSISSNEIEEELQDSFKVGWSQNTWVSAIKNDLERVAAFDPRSECSGWRQEPEKQIYYHTNKSWSSVGVHIEPQSQVPPEDLPAEEPQEEGGAGQMDVLRRVRIRLRST